ncbi:MAG: hypothetical protein ACLR06_09405 [Christensenellaceae bacterium]
MNAENLTKINRSPSEARENGSKGGKQSGKARRKKKQMKDMFEYLLGLDVTDAELKKKMSEMGIDDGQMTYNAMVCYSMLRMACAGSVKAATFIRDTTGQKPQDNVKIEGTVEIETASAAEYFEVDDGGAACDSGDNGSRVHGNDGICRRA